jgi:hypothetical protein
MAAATRGERPALAPALGGISLLKEFLCRGRKTLIKLRQTPQNSGFAGNRHAGIGLSQNLSMIGTCGAKGQRRMAALHAGRRGFESLIAHRLPLT